jgi:hypothetical protein
MDMECDGLRIADRLVKGFCCICLVGSFPKPRFALKNFDIVYAEMKKGLYLRLSNDNQIRQVEAFLTGGRFYEI